MKQPGLSRELAALYAESQAVPVALDQFQAKPRLGTRAERWVWRGFKSSARSDGLVLRHWVRASEQPGDYFYARYNARARPYQYTDEEYDRCIEPLDAGWTRVETDYLLHLCALFDLRFLVIHDRYYSHPDCPSFGVAPGRVLEDLKARYYAIGRALTQHRAGEDARDPEDVPLQATNKLADDLALLCFDRDKELERKQYLQALFARTQAEIEEEELLIAEARRIEASERRMAHEREALLQTHALFEEAAPAAVGPPVKVQFAQDPPPPLLLPGSPSGTPAAAEPTPTPKARRASAADGPGDPAAPRPLKKQRSAHAGATPHHHRGRPAGAATPTPTPTPRAHAPLRSPPPGAASPSASASPARGLGPRSERSGSPVRFGVPTFSTEDHIVKPAITEVDAPDVGPIAVPQRDARLGPGVFLRSDKLHTIPKNKLDAAKQFMAQLSLTSPNTVWPRPVMATAAVCDRFDSLQALIIPLLDYKRAAEKLETEIQTLRARRRMLIASVGASRAESILADLPPLPSPPSASAAAAAALRRSPSVTVDVHTPTLQRRASTPANAAGRKKQQQQ